MKKILIASSLLIASVADAQTVSSRPKMEQGQAFEILLDVKTTVSQQAMGQAIDFNVDATGKHTYKVTNATPDNNTLNHQVNRITFKLDGMGQNRNFDSDVEKDLNGPFGKPVKDILSKKYDIIIDPAGMVMLARPEKLVLAEGDSRLAIVTSMLKDVLDIVQPPQKGKSSFFAVLPATETAKNQPWTESYTNEHGKFDAAYTISDINDSTIVVDFVSSSVTVTKAELMGNETTTTMNNKGTGKIIIDRQTGIIRQKTTVTEANGSTEASFGTLPVTSKTTSTIIVKPLL